MVYLVGNKKEFSNIVLVKADSREVVESRLVFKEDEGIVGRLTDSEITVLYSSEFVVIQA